VLKAIAGRESGHGNNLTEEQWRQAHQMFMAGSADAYLKTQPPVQVIATPGKATGAGLLTRALEHIHEPYSHVQVPKDDPNYKGPWDCSEFISWLVFQEAGRLYGCEDDTAAPSKAKAYTGDWKADVERLGIRVSIDQAAATVAGIVLRYPPGTGLMGHIALCDGKGGTVEAKGVRYGVIADTVHGRGWDTGILIPGIDYQAASAMKITPPDQIYKLGAPDMNKDVIVRIQTALVSKGVYPGIVDGNFALSTRDAVAAFQEAEGLVVDGEVGPETAAALGISLAADPGTTDRGGPPGPQNGGVVLPPNSSQLLTLMLMLLSKEKPMADDPAKSGQGVDLVALLLPLLLQSALGGKPIDTTQLLTLLLTGQPVMPSTSTPTIPVTTPVTIPPAQTQPSQPAPADLTMLLPLIYEKLTGKPLPGTTPVTPPTPADQPAASTQSILTRPSVQIGAAGLGISTILQALGAVGMPFGVTGGPAAPTQTGTLATLIPLIIGAFGATGGFGALANVGGALLGGLANVANKSKQ
jgi:hypothetical protein